jgi:hypothetical protein
MASTRAHGTGGRILPHQRDANNSVPILGAGLNDLGANYNDLYNKTLQHNMNDRTRKDYRYCNICVAKYWDEHCPEYYPVGARDVSPEDLVDVGKFFYGRYDKDIVYQGLNVKYMLKFCISLKKKENVKFLSFTDIWGVSMVEEQLPTTFNEDIKKYLKGYKKELVKAQKDGNLDEQAADPILFALYFLLLTWSVESVKQYFLLVLDAGTVDFHGSLCLNWLPWFSQLLFRG